MSDMIPREKEYEMIQEAFLYAKKHDKRVHIRGISSLEAVESIREYYREKGYEDALAKNYTLPPDELVTVSISLRHALWCEKDKLFLQQKHSHSAFGHVSPPLRSPADLRSLQQALRMGIIMGLEMDEHTQPFLPDLIKKQILSAYQIASLFSVYWLKHNFPGNTRDMSIILPQFSSTVAGD
jgi:dihydroorotase-like cyclic amidohydrolase